MRILRFPSSTNLRQTLFKGATVATLCTAALTRSSEALAQCEFLGEQDFRLESAQRKHFFGSGLAVEGEWAAIGISGWRLGGACQIYRRDGSGTWQPTELLLPTNVSRYANFGSMIAMSGDLLIVGASADRPTGWTDEGSAFVYRRNGNRWVEEARLWAFDTSLSGGFGSAVATDGTLVIVSAPGKESVYVFRNEGAGWMQEKKIRPLGQLPQFGSGLAFHEDELAIGAVGRVQIFRREARDWVYDHQLFSPGGSTADLFGFTLARSANVLAASAPREGSGAVHLFRKEGDRFTLFQTLIGTGLEGTAFFGRSLSISERNLAVTSLQTQARVATVHLFRASQGTWTLNQRIENPNPPSDPSEGFGFPLALDGASLFVGAQSSTVDDVLGAGRAYSYLDRSAFEVVARGGVNSRTGTVRDVLFLNGSSGGRNRRVEYNVLGPFELRVDLPPSLALPDRAPFALYLWPGLVPKDNVPSPNPFGLECGVLPFPMSGQGPTPRLIWNNAGRRSILGMPNRSSEPAPSRLVYRPRGVRTPGNFFVQGVIYDPFSSAPVPASVTNGFEAIPVFR